MIFALLLFIFMYILLLRFSDKRWAIALMFVAIFIILGFVPFSEVLGAVNWNIILMLAGTMITVQLFIDSKMPLRMSEALLKITPNVTWAVVALCLFAGIVSAFVDNVATLLMIAPIGLAMCKQLDINPVPVIISISVSSNLQGAATLVGDTTSILLGTYANMSFNDFFWFQGRPGICLAVELGALATIPVLLFIFRDYKNKKVTASQPTKVTDYVPTVLMFGTILALIIASQFENRPDLINGYICMGFAIFGIFYEWIRSKSTNFIGSIRDSFDWQTLLLLIGLFIVIQGITNAGVIDAIASLFVKIGNGNVLVTYILIVVASVALSAFIDNIPYVATMLPVVTGISALLGINPYLLDFGLLIGATLGGNITPVGASANIAGIGILQKNGYKVSTKDFMRIGVPFTLIAAFVGAVTIWIIWA